MNIISKWVASFKPRISSRCSSWTCASQHWWRSPLYVIDHGPYEIFIWCKPMERYLTIHINATHISWVSSQKLYGQLLTVPRDTWSHLVHLVALCVDQYLDQTCIFTSIFNRWWCLEDNHEWLHNPFLQDILAISSTRWSWCQILHYINIFMASTLNPTYGVQAWSMDKHYK